MRDQRRIFRFDKPDPGRAAGGKLRQRADMPAVRVFLSENRMARAGDEFRPFFHDGQIRREIVVQNVKSRFSHRAVEFSGHETSRGKPKILADGHAHGRSDDADDRGILILQFGDNRVHRIRRFIRRAERTVDQTLSATQAQIRIDAVRRAEHARNGARRTMSLAGVASLANGRFDGDHAGNFPFLICFCSYVHFPFPPLCFDA